MQWELGLLLEVGGMATLLLDKLVTDYRAVVWTADTGRCTVLH